MMRRLRGVLGIAVIIVGIQLAGATAANAAYPGANGLIAFVRAGDIDTINPTTRIQKRLTFTANNGSPVWSPNGKLIAFTSLRSGSRDIWVMNANGSNQHRITTASTPEDHPAWSPDGKWLAFDSPRGPRQDYAIFKIRSTSPYGSAIRLTTPPPPTEVGDFGDYAPTWSPLGGNIVFARSDPCGEPSCSTLFRVSSSGGTAKEIGVGSDTWAPDYAPKGRAIAFTADFDSLPYYEGPLNIWISQSDGSNRHYLTTDLDWNNPVSNDNPAWAPTGTKLAFDRWPCVAGTCATHADVWTIHSDGTSAKLLVKNASDPNWQPIHQP